MKKLIHLLAVSAGSGLLLGAGMRLAEIRGTRDSGADGGKGKADDDRLALLAERIESLENKIARMGPDGMGPDGMGPEGREPEPNVSEPKSAGYSPVSAPQSNEELSGRIAVQMEQLEARLRHDLSRRSDDRLDALLAKLQDRMAERIESLETELANQRAAVGELRECSLRNERSLQKLLEGIDRLVDARAVPAPGIATLTRH